MREAISRFLNWLMGWLLYLDERLVDGEIDGLRMLQLDAWADEENLDFTVYPEFRLMKDKISTGGASCWVAYTNKQEDISAVGMCTGQGKTEAEAVADFMAAYKDLLASWESEA